MFSDVSGQPIDPFFRGKAVRTHSYGKAAPRQVQRFESIPNKKTILLGLLDY